MQCVQLTKRQLRLELAGPFGAAATEHSLQNITQPEGPDTASLQAALHHAVFVRTCAEQVVQRRKQLVHALQATGADNSKG